MFSKKKKFKTKELEMIYLSLIDYVAMKRYHSIPSIINPNLSIEGTVDAIDVLEVFGSINGNVKSCSVHIRENGRIKGIVFADHVRIEGRFDGDIHARIVELSSSSHVTGNIHYGFLSMEENAYFDGHCSFDHSQTENLPC